MEKQFTVRVLDLTIAAGRLLANKPGMASMNAAELGLIGACLGLLPPTIGAIVSWLRSRDKMNVIRQKEELRKIQIESLSSWIDVALKIPDKDISDRHIASATEKLEDLVNEAIEVRVEL